ncbi:hypothetical protein AAT19DRAFT_16819 [Rhodotorula toruloides]|uniref:Uncharacterized protein n=1 Tax=Rhodotorula toruloides TaxID=5286 RepID=A0A2T0A4G1_RHOTO|nr:hypothetical protein AAT19DRAFT_16819 [Rhodotorula toruloides]
MFFLISQRHMSARQPSLRDVNETNASWKSSRTILEARRMYSSSLLHHPQISPEHVRPLRSRVQATTSPAEARERRA